MKVNQTTIPGVILLEPRVFEDQRGYFFETYKAADFVEYGITCQFVQDNQSLSHRNVLRGLHYQLRNSQAKLVRVVRGEVYDVVVDVRKNSPWFGKHFGITLSGSNRRMLFIPEGFAHGFCVLSDSAEFVYKCSAYYSPQDERGILWSDPDIGIAWPIPAGETPIISDKDSRYERLADMPLEDLPNT